MKKKVPVITIIVAIIIFVAALVLSLPPKKEIVPIEGGHDLQVLGIMWYTAK